LGPTSYCSLIKSIARGPVSKLSIYSTYKSVYCIPLTMIVDRSWWCSLSQLLWRPVVGRCLCFYWQWWWCWSCLL